MFSQQELKAMHNGLIKCPLRLAPGLMPEIVAVLDECPLPCKDYVVDAKVHMLMPQQYPCIPNWHGDAIPRGDDGVPNIEACNDDLRLFLWLSGPPFTEFKDGRKIKACEWIEFKQRDIHRGTASESHQWRLFIRLMPTELVVRPRSGDDCLRRHSQVYLDASNFTW